MNHFIPLSKAIALTSFYRAHRESILQTLHQGHDVLPISETFDRAAFDRVLSQEGCTGLRLYYGMDEDYQVHAVIVGVNANNEDILPTASSATHTMAAIDEEDSFVIDKGLRCPDICGATSVLNP